MFWSARTRRLGRLRLAVCGGSINFAGSFRASKSSICAAMFQRVCESWLRMTGAASSSRERAWSVWVTTWLAARSNSKVRRFRQKRFLRTIFSPPAGRGSLRCKFGGRMKARAQFCARSITLKHFPVSRRSGNFCACSRAIAVRRSAFWRRLAAQRCSWGRRFSCRRGLNHEWRGLKVTPRRRKSWRGNYGRQLMAEKKGQCFLVGAGPGDLGLVTLRARECIEQAEVIVYDYLCNPEMLRWAPENAELIFAGKKAAAHTLTQDEINELLVEKTRNGKNVVRLKGGDPFLFGRGAEEAQALAAAGLPFVIVPGVSSAIAGPAYAGIPVTHRGKNSHVTFFTGHEDPTKEGSAIDFAALAKLGGTQVMLMGVERIGAIAREMMTNGVPKHLPVALIRWATTERQRTLVGTLENIAQKVAAKGFAAPAIAVLGEVVNMRDELNWCEDRPLSGKRIVVTRTRQQAGAL